jgi:hypothetical protein
MKRFRHALAGLLLGCGLIAVATGLAGCPPVESLCEQACKNYASKCGPGSLSSSSSSGTQGCVHQCEAGAGSKSGSSSAAYSDMLSCVAHAGSCLEIQNVCNP